MLKIEILYNGSIDKETLKKAHALRAKYDGKANVGIMDISQETAPPKYGTVNAPTVVIDGKHAFKIEGPDNLSEIVRNAIF
ncbi:MAG: hypothetical protein C0602_10755 [Denitrovibrio sp.]|nr:MAG: hypothetical protein C0602_10755 [Denitrovibrio sp.]